VVRSAKENEIVKNFNGQGVPAANVKVGELMYQQQRQNLWGGLSHLWENNGLIAALSLAGLLTLSACGGSSNTSTENDLADSGADGVAPTLTEVAIYNGADLSDSVALGEEVLVAFTASEALMKPSVTINGVAADVEDFTDTGTNNLKFKATRAMTADDPEGVVTFSITFTDRSGEAGAPVSSTTDDTSVTYCVEGCAASCEAPEATIFDFEDMDTPRVFADFGPDGTARTAALSAVVPDPTDGSNSVVASEKDAAAEVWGGSWVVEGTEAEPLKALMLTEGDPLVSIRFWSPAAGKTVKMKLEVADNGSVFVEADATTTVVGDWETLTFDFANPAAGSIDPFAEYGKIVIFYDFGTAGVGEAVAFYWDDVTQGGVGFDPDSCGNEVEQSVLDFDDATATFVFADFGPDAGGGRGAAESMVVADPEDATNSVVASQKDAAAEVWGGSWVVAGSEAAPEFTLSLTPADPIVSLRFWSPAAGKTVKLKLEVANDGSVFVEADATTTEAGAWQTLYFDFSAPAAGAIDPFAAYGKFVVFYDFGTAGSGAAVSFYWDDITHGGVTAAGPTAPTTVADAPTVAAGSVLSIFSDSYTNAAGTNVNPDWGQQTVVSAETVAGESVLKYAGLNYQGTILSPALDVSGYDTLHIDFWTTDAENLRFFLINSGDVTGGDAVEVAYTFDTSMKGQWVSVDIPLTAFDGVDLTQVDQFKVDGSGTIFFDNWYFCSNCNAPASAPTTVASAPSADAGSVVSIFSDSYTDVSGTDVNPDWGQATMVSVESIAGESVLKYADLNYQGTILTPALDVSGYDTLHIDFWTADSESLRFFLINSGGITGGDPVEVAYTFDTSMKGEWVSVDIPLATFDGVDLTQVDQFKVDGSGTVFFDNWYFTCDGGCGSSPASIASAPTVPAENVISVFSDAYENVAGTDTNPNWGQATVVSAETIAGESVLKYSDLNYQGTILSPPLDVSGYETLHIDFWTADAESLRFFLINSGDITGGDAVEVAYTFDTSMKGQWVSVDIPLTAFDGVDLTQVDQFKVDGTGTIFFDNWYFCKECATAPSAVASAPTAEAGSVLSIFSDKFEDVAGTNVNPNWGQATLVSVETIAGESVLKYGNLNYQGTILSPALDVSGYTSLHIDFWTADSDALRFFLINSGDITGGDAVEVAYTFDTSMKRQWVSVDIPLTTFDGVDLTQVDQFKVDGSGTIYFDNWYFE